MRPDEVRESGDLDGLDKEGLVAFLNGEREDKVELWNAWREANDWEPVDLEGADLSLARLAGANLGWARLEGANLLGARLERANLGWARLAGADLQGVELDEANLFEARLERAELFMARLERADLRGARLREVALSSVGDAADNNRMRGAKLYQTYFWGVLSLRYEQFLDENGDSTIWEETEGHFSEAKDVYKSLKGYFEDAGDYEGANWAYVREQVMEKLMHAPRWLRPVYGRWRGRWDDNFCRPSFGNWVRLQFFEVLANYGTNLLLPFLWLLAVLAFFTTLYWAFGLATTDPTCAYEMWHVGCVPTRSIWDNLLFSLGAMTTTDVGFVQPYQTHVGIVMTIEALFGIALTGLVGFVLGNKLRYS